MPRYNSPPTPAQIAQRFWKHVKRIRGCWRWTGATKGGGYGAFQFEGRPRLAHRFAWELAKGPIPPGMKVLHRCDNRTCCNPAHLFLGTTADNHADMVAKGRGIHCERNGRAKLTRDAVRHIRASDWAHSDLALKYGVTATAIRLARIGRTWQKNSRPLNRP